MGDPNGEGRQAGDLYYGTIDATPLFVMLLGEVRRWGLADDLLTVCCPTPTVPWSGSRPTATATGDGFVEYAEVDRPRTSQPGLEGLVGLD